MSESDQLFSAARQLLSGSFSGILSTHSLEMPGYPFGSLLPYSLGPDGWPVLLMSHLSKHTRNVEAVPQCSLTLVEKGGGDIQTLMRLTCLGDLRAAEVIDPAATERHFRYFPDSRDYYQQLNFRFYQFQPQRFYCVGGFGAARWMGADRLTYITPFRPDQELLLIREMHTRHNDPLREYLNRQSQIPALTETIEIAGIDGLGLDIRLSRELLRIPFIRPVTKAAQLDRTLVETLETTSTNRQSPG
ncbi:MAG: hypothetical protein C0631_07225 [Sedimenticola sp.]|nr:MAG: hypothetical protein C0631_07225 [Sedimenticola sp.]